MDGLVSRIPSNETRRLFFRVGCSACCVTRYCVKFCVKRNLFECSGRLEISWTMSRIDSGLTSRSE